MSGPVALLVEELLLRECLAEGLQQRGLEVVSCDTEAHLLDLLRQVQPRVVVVDMGAGPARQELVALVPMLLPQVPVVVLYGEAPGAEGAEHYARLGAAASLDRARCGVDVLLRLVRAVERGERLAPAHVPAPPPLAPRAPSPLDRLTPRERAVLRLVATGADNATIAQLLGVRDRTVRGYLSSLYAKLACETRAQMAIRACDLGLRPPPGRLHEVLSEPGGHPRQPSAARPPLLSPAAAP